MSERSACQTPSCANRSGLLRTSSNKSSCTRRWARASLPARRCRCSNWPRKSRSTTTNTGMATDMPASRSRLYRFLQFAVDQKLRNRSVRLKEYLIGVTVFERGENFNPGTDPIVRVQARRLRSKLNLYYETEGRADTVLIELPCGGYVPVFHFRAAAEHMRGLHALDDAPIETRRS